MERLVNKAELVRAAPGIYTRPKKSKVFGNVMPGVEEIAHTIAKRDKAKIIPTGNYALHALGLSTQVPLNIVYLTDGAPRKIKLGSQTIKFKKTTPKNLKAKGPISKLVLQAMKTIGKDKITEDEETIILDQLEKENPIYLEHDILLAPEWIRRIMRKAITARI